MRGTLRGRVAEALVRDLVAQLRHCQQAELNMRNLLTDAFAEGDDVFGMAASGGYAEFATASADVIARKPAALSHEQAAAIPVAGMTAWQALFDRGGLGTQGSACQAREGPCEGAREGRLEPCSALGHHPPLEPASSDDDLVGWVGVGLRGVLVREHDHVHRQRDVSLQSGSTAGCHRRRNVDGGRLWSREWHVQGDGVRQLRACSG